jgi:hypothetical protein
MVTTPIREQHPPRWAGLVRDRGHGGRLRRTSDTFPATEDPAGVSGHLRGVVRMMKHAIGRWPRNPRLRALPCRAPSDGAAEGQRGDGKPLSLLAPQAPGFARGLDRRLLDRGDGALELVGIARADRDEAGRP